MLAMSFWESSEKIVNDVYLEPLPVTLFAGEIQELEVTSGIKVDHKSNNSS